MCVPDIGCNSTCQLQGGTVVEFILITVSLVKNLGLLQTPISLEVFYITNMLSVGCFAHLNAE